MSFDSSFLQTQFLGVTAYVRKQLSLIRSLHNFTLLKSTMGNLTQQEIVTISEKFKTWKRKYIYTFLEKIPLVGNPEFIFFVDSFTI